MGNPRCPSCNKRFAYVQGFRFLLPCKWSCPRCSATLELSTPWKRTYFAVLVVVAMGLGLALYPAVRARWQFADAVQFLFWAVILIVPLSRFAWHRIRLERSNPA